MTDNEIIKALEEHIERTKNIKYGARKMAMVDADLIKDTLDLINQQKAEIERLTNKCEDCAGCAEWKCDCSNKGITDLFLIDKEFVKTALLREIERRKGGGE